jgi:hypothetical protein
MDAEPYLLHKVWPSSLHEVLSGSETKRGVVVWIVGTYRSWTKLGLTFRATPAFFFHTYLVLSNQTSWEHGRIDGHGPLYLSGIPPDGIGPVFSRGSCAANLLAFLKNSWHPDADALQDIMIVEDNEQSCMDYCF